MFSWFKKAQEADKTLKPESEKFKAEGTDGGIKINPADNTVGANVQQHIEKIEVPISPAPKIPAAEVKKYTKAQLEKKAAEGKVDAESTQYKAKGDSGKLQFPTKQDIFPANVKQPGLSGSEDAGSKTYKAEGKVEKLEVPTKPAALPEGGMVVSTDEKSGKEFKPEGEKEKLMTTPKEFKGGEGQPKSDVAGDKYFAKHDKAGKINKQFSEIKWFKRAANTDEKRSEIIKKEIEKGHPKEQAAAIAYDKVGESKKEAALSMETADIIIKAALDCPTCFNKVVAYINSMRNRKATLTADEATTLKTLSDKAATTALTPEEQTQMQTISAKACQYIVEHEKKHHGGDAESPEHAAHEAGETETEEALEQMAIK